MNTHAFHFAGAHLHALPSGALYWRAQATLVVSDLHLGKSARLSEVGGAQLPPYDNHETLERLDRDIAAFNPQHVICLGDSFDSAAIARALPEEDRLWITRLQAGRRWTWILGNHDPGPFEIGGTHHADIEFLGLQFCHIATSDRTGQISGHYHPKARIQTRGRAISKPCFLYDQDKLILPAYGAYTGGLRTDSAVLSALMQADAIAILTGRMPVAIPMPRRAAG
jgi:DNA ligase-associated metallophosphoesterase